MVNESLAKATLVKHLEIILSLSRLLNYKDWRRLTKDDIDRLVSIMMQKYSETGQETSTTWDHKKILKRFKPYRI